MKPITSIKAAILLPLALLSVASPASANWFSIDPATGMRRHIGSAPNPTPADLREMRADRENELAKESSGNEGSNGLSIVKSE